MLYFYPRSPCGERHPVQRADHISHCDFYPRSPCGERRWTLEQKSLRRYFYPRSPCGERQHRKNQIGQNNAISIHALLAESDAGASSKRYKSFDFYPRSPCGERRGAGLCPRPADLISIHALLAESDRAGTDYVKPKHNFYPRSPCGERRARGPPRAKGPNFYPRSPCGERPVQRADHIRHGVFLSTLSLRRATASTTLSCCQITHFYPRSPCGERLGPLALGGPRAISIHALLAESDAAIWYTSTPWMAFLSTLSLRRATAKVHKTVGHFCAYETTFMGIASSC